MTLIVWVYFRKIALLSNCIIIIFYPFSTRLSLTRAIKAKQTLSKLLFEWVFKILVNRMMSEASQDSSLACLSMLDIAGFGN